MNKSIPISVIGSNKCNVKIAAVAEEVGRELAKRGATVVCGGLGGVMEAACKGAHEAGGRTIGILPREDPSEANQWVDVKIVTGMGYARNAVVVKSGMAVIAIDGAFGTLSEIGHALGQLDPLTVIGLGTWALSKNGELALSIIPADSPVDAVEKAIEAAKEREKRICKG